MDLRKPCSNHTQNMLSTFEDFFPSNERASDVPTSYGQSMKSTSPVTVPVSSSSLGRCPTKLTSLRSTENVRDVSQLVHHISDSLEGIKDALRELTGEIRILRELCDQRILAPTFFKAYHPQSSQHIEEKREVQELRTRNQEAYVHQPKEPIRIQEGLPLQDAVRPPQTVPETPIAKSLDRGTLIIPPVPSSVLKSGGTKAFNENLGTFEGNEVFATRGHSKQVIDEKMQQEIGIGGQTILSTTEINAKERLREQQRLQLEQRTKALLGCIAFGNSQTGNKKTLFDEDGGDSDVSIRKNPLFD